MDLPKDSLNESKLRLEEDEAMKLHLTNIVSFLQASNIDMFEQPLDKLEEQLKSDEPLQLSLRDSAEKLHVLGFVSFLQASEYELIEVMIHNNIWIGSPPVDPGGSGEVMYGLFLYWIHNPPNFIQKLLDEHKIFKAIWDVFQSLAPTQISTENYNALLNAVKTMGVVAMNGSIFGLNFYESLDANWLWAAIDYMISTISHNRVPFSTTNVPPISLVGSRPQRVKIALLGDWGTGDDTAKAIINQVLALKPDYIIHLGDVYYAGTAGDFLPLNEEKNNFLALWPPIANSFALNSNHEMYSGGKGYFNVLLADQRFSQQQKTSYFALAYGGWTILGLDSAYFSHSVFFTNGSLGGPDDGQISWIKNLNLSANKVIVLTHHNGLTDDGSKETNLWTELNSALGGDPAAWYWGHVHNGIVYKSPTVTGRNTLARCTGHAAFPFGNAWELNECENIVYYAHTPNPDGGVRVYNGFTMLTIKSDGTVKEDFYEQNTKNPVFSNSFLR
ncbi:MAG: metallophosphoesterase [Acidobacteria bacterium]|nr:metallophosphoesterase [Acidobacteriota bacterium]